MTVTLIEDEIDGLRLAALAMDGRVTDLAAAPADHPARTGLIAVARVAGRDPSGGGFLDLGDGGAGFLKRAGHLRDGDRLLVQVTAEAPPGKALPVTDAPSLAGGTCVATVGGKPVQLSKRLGDRDADDWQRALEGVAGEGVGLILRSNAPEAGLETVRAEAAGLVASLRAALDTARSGAQPGVVLPAHGLGAGLVLNAGLGDVPRRADPAVDLAALVAESLAPVTALRAGGLVRWGTTPALTAVDVDRHRAKSVTRANTDAALAVARRLRLANLGGLVVVDFIGFGADGAVRDGVATLARATRGDPGNTDVTPRPSRLGLAELSRTRRGYDLAMAARLAGWPPPATAEEA